MLFMFNFCFMFVFMYRYSFVFSHTLCLTQHICFSNSGRLSRELNAILFIKITIDFIHTLVLFLQAYRSNVHQHSVPYRHIYRRSGTNSCIVHLFVLSTSLPNTVLFLSTASLKKAPDLRRTYSHAAVGLSGTSTIRT